MNHHNEKVQQHPQGKKRLTIALVISIALVSLSAIAINRHQRRTLADSLITDFSRFDTWSVPAHGTRHDNAFQCFVDHTRRLTADELTHLKQLRSNVDHDSLADAGTLRDWAVDAQHCIDARRIAPVEGMRSVLTNTNLDAESARGPFIRLAIFDAAEKLDAGLTDEAAEGCVEVGENLVALSHLSLIDNMFGWMGARLMSTPCARAWGEMSEPARARLLSRIERLPRELAPNATWLRFERSNEELIAFGTTLTPEERARLPQLDLDSVDLGVWRFTAPTGWAASRRRFDELIALADTPGEARREASVALDESFHSWLIGATAAGAPGYEKFLARRDDVQRALVLLSDIAARRTPTLPPGARVGDGGIEWQFGAEHPLWFPLK